MTVTLYSIFITVITIYIYIYIILLDHHTMGYIYTYMRCDLPRIFETFVAISTDLQASSSINWFWYLGIFGPRFGILRGSHRGLARVIVLLWFFRLALSL